MEFAAGGELFEYIVKRKRLKDLDASKFLKQIIGGVEYMHKCGICHRDLKPENLLLDDQNNIKIVDFGLSNTYSKGQTLKTACGSPCYAAPEMIAGKRYHGLGSDIWSCGIILFAMTAGYLPFEDPNTNKLYKKILACDYSMPTFLGPDTRDLLTRMLVTNPGTRCGMHDIRKHNFYGKSSQVPDMDGIVVGVDQIPILAEFIDELQPYFGGESLEQAPTYVKNNKHNSVTATYYLLIKKKERSSRRDYVFEDFMRQRKQRKVAADSLARNRNTSPTFIYKQRTETASRLSDHQNAEQGSAASHVASSSQKGV